MNDLNRYLFILVLCCISMVGCNTRGGPLTLYSGEFKVYGQLNDLETGVPIRSVTATVLDSNLEGHFALRDFPRIVATGQADEDGTLSLKFAYSWCRFEYFGEERDGYLNLVLASDGYKSTVVSLLVIEHETAIERPPFVYRSIDENWSVWDLGVIPMEPLNAQE